MEPKHTPTPWKKDKRFARLNAGDCRKLDCSVAMFGANDDPQALANRDFAFRAVNSHEELVKAAQRQDEAITKLIEAVDLLRPWASRLVADHDGDSNFAGKIARRAIDIATRYQQEGLDIRDRARAALAKAEGK